MNVDNVGIKILDLPNGPFYFQRLVTNFHIVVFECLANKSFNV